MVEAQADRVRRKAKSEGLSKEPEKEEASPKKKKAEPISSKKTASKSSGEDAKNKEIKEETSSKRVVSSSGSSSISQVEEKKEDKKADDKKKEAAKKIAVTKNALAISKAPLVTIRFGNLIQEDGGALLGWISNWSANPVLEMGMFTPSRGLFFPKVFNATISFTPQHKQDLAFNSGSTGNPTSFPYRGK